jgi:bifunctional non-homologous end joining protein LigD
MPAKRAKADPLPRNVSPMLATLADAPFDDPAWLFEVKWDGYRAIAIVAADGTLALTSRNGLDLLKRFKDIGAIGAAFRSLPVIVDGEVCAIDAAGRSSFQALQQADIAVRGTARAPLTYVAFDLLYADGRDLRELPLEERKARLEKLIVPDRGVMYSKHIIGRGKDFFALAQRESLEGIIAKRRDSPYRMARSRDWFKIKAKHEEEFVIGGWTEPKGSRSEFGALLLGYYEGKKLIFAGQAGTGFNAKLLRDIGAELRKRERKTSPFEAVPRMKPEPHFVKPELVAQIVFAEWTHDGLLRQPVFLGLRRDKRASEVTRERAQPSLRPA